jgi:hypothetical protein
MRIPGRLAQLGEHSVYTRKVTGSSPVPPIFSSIQQQQLAHNLQTEVALIADQLEISENEALVYLALLRAEASQRQKNIRPVIDRRRAAVSKERRVGTLPSPEEMQAAILHDRY